MNLNDRTILIAEDEEGVRKNIAEFLSLTCKNVYEAKDGLEAYALYKETAPDLIITDINMPGMDGLSLVEKIREFDKDLPIIIVSAHSEKEKLLRAVKLNLTDYIIKPIERKTLKTLIKKAFTEDETVERAVKIVPLGEGFAFDHANKMLYRHESRVELTKHQRLLIDILVQQKNQVVSGTDIFFHVQDDYTLEYNSAAVRNLVKKIRKIFPDEMIKNVYGSGYTLIVQENKIQEHISKHDGVLEAVAILDESNSLIGCNEMMLQMFGFTHKEELLGRDLFTLALALEKEKVVQALQHDTYTTDEIYLKRKDNTVFLAKTRCKQSKVDGRNVRTVSIMDLSETLKRYAVDPLTSLRTRAVLELEFTNLMQRYRMHGEAACAIFVDIDNFKSVNDTAGHQMRDQVIQSVADILVSGVRSDDVIVRWGGDEFLILLFNTPIEAALKAAEHIREDIGTLSLECCNDFSCSFGLDALQPDDTLEQLISRIDQALIQAKRNSKNCVVQFESSAD